MPKHISWSTPSIVRTRDVPPPSNILDKIIDKGISLCHEHPVSAMLVIGSVLLGILASMSVGTAFFHWDF